MADVVHTAVITHTCAEHAAVTRQQTMRRCSIAMQNPCDSSSRQTLMLADTIELLATTMVSVPD